MSKQLINALKSAKRDGYILAMQEMHAKMSAHVDWAQATAGDTEYHRGLRDGIVRAWEAIGLNRWNPTADTKSGK